MRQVKVAEYVKMTGTTKQNVYDKIKRGKLKTKTVMVAKPVTVILLDEEKEPQQ